MTTTPHPLKVLLVEDDKSHAILLRMLVIHNNYKYPQIKVDVTETIKATIELLRSKSKSATYDIILLDLKLDDADELTGLKRIVAENFDIPIICYSGSYSPELAYAAMDLGAEDYIIKGSMDQDEMLRILAHTHIRYKKLKKYPAGAA